MSLRKLVLYLHLILGLGVGLILVSAGLSGSVLVWRHEIDALLHPGLLRVEPAQRKLSLQQLVEVANRAYPDRPAARIQMARTAGESLEVTTAGADPLQVYVDPYRGIVLGARRPTETFANALFYWHSSLLSGETGEVVAGTAALLLLVLVLSGLVVWWPGMRRLGDAVRVKRSANWKRVTFDLHRAGGFWSAFFLVVVAVTGSSLVFHDAYMAALNWVTRSPPRPAVPVVSPLPGEPALPLDRLVERANAAIPGGEVTYLTLPQAPTAPLIVRKKVPEELHPNGRNFVYLHPQTAEVLALEHAPVAPVGTRAYNALYPIHIGRWGGIGSRVLYSVLGLVPLVLFVSGVLMWRNRTRGGTKKRPPRTRLRREPVQESRQDRPSATATATPLIAVATKRS